MEPDERRRSLRASIKDGFAFALMQGFGERNLFPFAVFLSAPTWAFGFLNAFPNLAGGVFQVLGANTVDRTGRRKPYFVGGAVAQAVSWAPLVAAPFLPSPWGLALLLLSYTLYMASWHFTLPPWTSTMGDLVPPPERGRYFGTRNFLAGAGNIGAFAITAVALDSFRPDGEALVFASAFFAALLMRLVSAHYLNRMHDPPYHPVPESRFTLAEFVRRRGNFGMFVLFVSLFFLSVTVAAPFFADFMLKDLGWSYTEYMILNNLHMIFFFASQPMWGRLADRRGNRFLLRVGGLGIALIPALWLVDHSIPYLAAVQLYDGLVWAAFHLGAWNYLLDAVSPPKRARCAAYYSLFTGLGLFAGSLIGAGVSELGRAMVQTSALPYAFYLPLAVSSVGRLCTAALFLPRLKDVRNRPAEEPATPNDAGLPEPSPERIRPYAPPKP